ncbi:hypothetical protein ACQCVP_17025 [Rossellomorea vietnamensis]
MSDLVSLYTFTQVFTSKLRLACSLNWLQFHAGASGQDIGGKGGFFGERSSFISGFLSLSALF